MEGNPLAGVIGRRETKSISPTTDTFFPPMIFLIFWCHPEHNRGESAAFDEGYERSSNEARDLTIEYGSICNT